MTKRKRATPTYAWAAMGKRSGCILRDLSGHYSIWTQRLRAEVDCPAYGRVARVRITEVK